MAMTVIPLRVSPSARLHRTRTCTQLGPQENEVRKAESGVPPADGADRRHVGRGGTRRAAGAWRIYGDRVGSGIAHVDMTGGIKGHPQGLLSRVLAPLMVRIGATLALGESRKPPVSGAYTVMLLSLDT